MTHNTDATPETCILLGIRGENADDCTTHDHAPADWAEIGGNAYALHPAGYTLVAMINADGTVDHSTWGARDPDAFDGGTNETRDQLDDLLNVAAQLQWPASTVTQMGGNLLALVARLPVLDDLGAHASDYPTCNVTVSLDGGLTVSACMYPDAGIEHDHSEDSTYGTGGDDDLLLPWVARARNDAYREWRIMSSVPALAADNVPAWDAERSRQRDLLR